jgi:ribonuclease HI
MTSGERMNRRTERIIAAIEALPEKERAELKKQLARFSWWTEEGRGRTERSDNAGKKSDYIIVFDGGSRGNPGPGYGSFLMVRQGDGAEQRKRLEFGPAMTSNEAEYDTLIAALQELHAWIAASGLEPAQASVEVRGDSQLVMRQVGGQWRARDARMTERRDRARALLRRFGGSRLVQQPRAESVRLLGH